jgi:hypothetical protein
MDQVYSAGDKVRHGEKPEWGVGVVEQSQVVPYAGGRAQRVVVRFPNHGRVTLNTAVARLVAEHAMAGAGAGAATGGGGAGGWLGRLEGRSPSESLRTLPDAVSDPLRSAESRLTVALDLYRFTTEPRSLLDWAVAQTGLSDPLSTFNRHELEEGFKQFAQMRDAKLIELARELKRSGRADLLEPRRYDKPHAQQALRRIGRAVA